MRFRYAIPMLLALGIIAVIVAGFSYTASPGHNPFSNIPTLVAGLMLILIAIVLSIVGKREKLDGI